MGLVVVIVFVTTGRLALHQQLKVEEMDEACRAWPLVIPQSDGSITQLHKDSVRTRDALGCWDLFLEIANNVSLHPLFVADHAKFGKLPTKETYGRTPARLPHAPRS